MRSESDATHCSLLVHSRNDLLCRNSSEIYHHADCLWLSKCIFFRLLRFAFCPTTGRVYEYVLPVRSDSIARSPLGAHLQTRKLHFGSSLGYCLVRENLESARANTRGTGESGVAGRKSETRMRRIIFRAFLVQNILGKFRVTSSRSTNISM